MNKKKKKRKQGLRDVKPSDHGSLSMFKSTFSVSPPHSYGLYYVSCCDCECSFLEYVK